MYYRVFHDIIEWAIANGYKRFYSGSLNYDPKWHLRQSLYPIDLYVRHTNGLVNILFRRLLPAARADPFRPDPAEFCQLSGAMGVRRVANASSECDCPLGFHFTIRYSPPPICLEDLHMKKFLVLYLVPPSVIEDWSKTAPEVREPAKRR